MISRGDNDLAWIGYLPPSYIIIDGSTALSTTSRGVILVVLDAVNCILLSNASFDTHASVAETDALMSYVCNLPVFTFLLGITHDEPEQYLSPAYPMFESELGINLTTLKWRGKFAFMAQVGYPGQTIWSLFHREALR